MPCTMLVLETVIGGKYYCPHFRKKATEDQKLDNLPKVLLVNWQSQDASTVFTTNPVSHHHDIHPQLLSHISYIPDTPVSNCVIIVCQRHRKSLPLTFLFCHRGFCIGS